MNEMLLWPFGEHSGEMNRNKLFSPADQHLLNRKKFRTLTKNLKKIMDLKSVFVWELTNESQL